MHVTRSVSKNKRHALRHDAECKVQILGVGSCLATYSSTQTRWNMCVSIGDGT
jgi:Na+-transporting NADH:ubiquinone oxidoreductase subunit NqrD